MRGKLAQQHHAGGFQPGCGGSVFARHIVNQQLGMRCGAHARHVIDILERIGDPMQRPAPFAGLDFRLGRCRRAARAIRGDGDEGIQLRIKRCNARQRCFRERHR
jgi:hypothetical protein